MIIRQIARPPKLTGLGLASRPKNPLAASPSIQSESPGATSQTSTDRVASLQNRTPVDTPPVNKKLHVITPKYNDYYVRKHAILKNQGTSTFNPP